MRAVVTLPSRNFKLSAPSHHTGWYRWTSIFRSHLIHFSFLSTELSAILLLLLHVVYERRVGTRTSLQDCNTRAVSLLVWLKFAWMSIFWTGPAVVGSQGLCGACSNCGFGQTVSTEQVELRRSWLEFQLELSVPLVAAAVVVLRIFHTLHS